jgi:murein DD-endopeptidase MepM/ murein hydrolase activator NlpD
MFDWIDDKHRLVLMNDETFQEERSFRLTGFNVFAIAGGVVMAVSLVTIILMIYTPLGYLVPERSTQEVRKQISEVYLLVDSLQQAVSSRDMYIAQMQGLVFEDFEYENEVEQVESEKIVAAVEDAPSTQKSEELQALIERVDNEAELGNLVESTLIEDGSVDAIIFNPPIKGIVSDSFAPFRGHFGTDIIAPRGEVIRATQRGTVIVATWSAATGHMIGIQHDNNAISFYKHNSSLLKKEGDIVRAGEGIAVIGNTGEMTDGPHLHFELWFNGQAINPERYISFRN